MPDAITRLYKGVVPTTSTTLYTVPASTSTVVRFVTVVNIGGSNRAFNLIFAGTRIFSGQNLQAGEQLTWEGGHRLAAAETITAEANAADLEIYITGVQET